MGDTQQYDAKNLEALRRDLRDLRAEAQEDGVLTPRGSKRSGAGARRRAAAPAAAETGPASADGESSGGKGKQVASRMLAALRRVENDDSLNVRGTDFTENGVKRLLVLLNSPRRRSGAADRILQRFQRFLTTPVPNSMQKIAGVSAEKIRLLSRLLEQIEQHGWDAVRSHLTERRERAAASEQSGAPADAASPVRRKRLNRQEAS